MAGRGSIYSCCYITLAVVYTPHHTTPKKEAKEENLAGGQRVEYYTLSFSNWQASNSELIFCGCPTQ